MNKEQYLALDAKLDSMVETLNAIEENSMLSNGTRRLTEMSLQDEAEELISYLKDEGYSQSEILKELQDTFNVSSGMASDIIEDYETMNDPKNNEATSGDIERAYLQYEAEGFPEDEIYDFLVKRFKLNRREIGMMID